MKDIKTLKKLIIIILICIIILSIIIIILFINSKKSNDDYIENVAEEYVHNGDTLSNQSITRVLENRTFYSIQNCIIKYETIVNLNYEIKTKTSTEPLPSTVYHIENEQQKREAIIKLLDEEYIKKYDINENNIDKYIDIQLGAQNSEVLKVNKLISNNLEVDGYSVYTKSENDEKFYIVKIDKKDQVFSIYPLEKNKYNNIDEINIEINTDNIEKNDRNIIIYSNINAGEIATKYFQEYKNLLLNKPQEAYEKLDKEYREKRFGSIQEFLDYVESNKEDFKLMQIHQYLLNTHLNYDEYVAKDIYENLYIFQETEPKEYTVKLDVYTNLTEELKEEYNKYQDEKKVQFQIDLFRQMINNRDFKSAYNVLDDGFKQNYFKTQEDFERYIKEKTFRYNKIEYKNIKKVGEVYTCETTLSDLSNGQYIDKTKQNVGQYNWNFVVQLEDAENFRISFDTGM